MKTAIRALRTIIVVTASLLTASCAPYPGGYYSSDIGDAGYYEERAVPVGGYYATPRPLPHGVLAASHHRSHPAHRDDHRSGPLVRHDRDDDNDKPKGKPASASSRSPGGPGPQKAQAQDRGPSRPGTSGPRSSRGDDDDRPKSKGDDNKKDNDDNDKGRPGKR